LHLRLIRMSSKKSPSEEGHQNDRDSTSDRKTSKNTNQQSILQDITTPVVTGFSTNSPPIPVGASVNQDSTTHDRVDTNQDDEITENLAEQEVDTADVKHTERNDEVEHVKEEPTTRERFYEEPQRRPATESQTSSNNFPPTHYDHEEHEAIHHGKSIYDTQERTAEESSGLQSSLPNSGFDDTPVASTRYIIGSNLPLRPHPTPL
jgi:hypothetical protein